MDKHGDVYMFPDPTIFSMPPKDSTGLEIEALSTMTPGLKWTDLVTCLNGLRHIMLYRGIFKEVHVKLFDQPSAQQMGVVNLRKISTVKPLGHGGLD